MSMTDPIADFLTRIRNGFLQKTMGGCTSSMIKKRISYVLKEENILKIFSLSQVEIKKS